MNVHVESGQFGSAFASVAMVKTIQRSILTLSNLPPNAMVTRCRTKDYVLARHIAMVVCLRLTKKGLAEIGRRFDRDHTTVLHAREKYWWVIDRIENSMPPDALPHQWCEAAWSAFHSAKEQSHG